MVSTPAATFTLLHELLRHHCGRGRHVGCKRQCTGTHKNTNSFIYKHQLYTCSQIKPGQTFGNALRVVTSCFEAVLIGHVKGKIIWLPPRRISFKHTLHTPPPHDVSPGHMRGLKMVNKAACLLCGHSRSKVASFIVLGFH